MRQTELLISLKNLKNNLQIIKSKTSSDIQAVIKANAYGLGYEEVVECIENDVESFAVITLNEAISLRKHTKKPITLLQGVHEISDYDYIEKYNLDFVVHTHWQLENLSKFHLNQSRIWFKLNTGMNRLGFNQNDFGDVYKKLKSLKAKDLIIMSHLAASSEPENKLNNAQIKLFNEITAGATNKKSLANSGAIFNFPNAHFDIVRSGIAIYGGKYLENGLKPVSKLRSKIISIRKVRKGECIGYDGAWTADEDCRICYAPIGYADGMPYFSSCRKINIDGKQFFTVGKVNMDLIAINLENDNSIKVGDWVEFWGFEDDLTKFSKNFDTISYQLMTNLSGRVEKNYLE